MTKSHFDRKVLLARRWSVMPARVVGDRSLKERELRVLGARYASTPTLWASVGRLWTLYAT